MKSKPRALILFVVLISVAASVSAQDIDWTRIYGGPIEDRAVTIEAVPGGDYYLLGNVRTDGGFLNMRVCRLNADGDSLWAVTLDHVASDLVVTDDGGCVVLGQAGDVPGSMHILLVEIDASGNVVDSVGVYAPLDEWAHDIERTLDGGLVFCGERDYPEGTDIWVVRLDQDYNTLWEYRGGGDWVDGAVEVKPLLDGGIVLGGYQGLHDDTAMPYIVRLDEQGEEVWSRMYMCDSVEVRSLTVAANGDLVLGGIYSRGPYYPFKHPWMLRCASNGDSLWTGTYDYDIAGFDRLYPLSDGSIFAYGHQGEYLYASFLAMQVGLDGTNLWAHNQKIDGYLTWGAACDVSSMQVDSSFVACGIYGYWDIHPDSMDMFVMKMQHNDYQLTGARVRALPEPVPFGYAYLVADTVGVDIFVGQLPGEPGVSDVDPASIVVNDSLTPWAVEVLDFAPGFAGEVLKVTVSARDFVSGYGALFDTTLQAVAIAGSFINGDTLDVLGELVMAGHLSGDLNGDLDVNVADLTYMLNYLFDYGPAPRIPGSANVDGIGAVNINDVTYLTNYLFADGPAPKCGE